MEKGVKKAILGLFSAGKDIRLAGYMIQELLGHSCSVAAVSSALDALLKRKKLVKVGRGSTENFMLPSTFERERQGREVKSFNTYPS